MPGLFLLLSLLRTVSAILGGFGVFYLILSFWAPALSGAAILLIGAASAMVYFLER
jgi:hypothetical protein